MGVLSETFETAITWDRFDAFHEAVDGATRAAVRRAARVTCRITHAYPDGAAPYFTVLAPARRGEEVEQWDAIKRAAADAILAGGGTITHHHAVGRDHRPGTTASGRSRSPPRCGRRRPPSTRAGSSTPAYSWIRERRGARTASRSPRPRRPTTGRARYRAQVKMEPFEIKRMQWEEGDTIAGLGWRATRRSAPGHSA